MLEDCCLRSRPARTVLHVPRQLQQNAAAAILQYGDAFHPVRHVLTRRVPGHIVFTIITFFLHSCEGRTTNDD